LRECRHDEALKVAYYARYRTEKQVRSGIQPYEFVRASSVHYLTFNTQARPPRLDAGLCRQQTARLYDLDCVRVLPLHNRPYQTACACVACHSISSQQPKHQQPSSR
jgi:hypothetical protein